jgi:hypothetical protein
MSDLSIQLVGRERADGTIYVTSPQLRGFHLVVARGEDPAEVAVPLALQFLATKLSRSEIKSEVKTSPRWNRERWTAEVEFA